MNHDRHETPEFIKTDKPKLNIDKMRDPEIKPEALQEIKLKIRQLSQKIYHSQ